MSGQAARLDHVLRFDVGSHEYSIDGTVIPSVTQLLSSSGYISEAFYTDASADRGKAVHQICADYDLGAFTKADIPAMTSAVKGWLSAYVRFTEMLRPTWKNVEVAHISVRYRFGGRPDREGALMGTPLAIVDIKSGPPERWHGIQCALQDILLSDADTPQIPIGVRQRFGLYLSSNGKFRLEPHTNKRDYDIAREIIRHCTL